MKKYKELKKLMESFIHNVLYWNMMWDINFQKNMLKSIQAVEFRIEIETMGVQ